MIGELVIYKKDNSRITYICPILRLDTALGGDVWYTEIDLENPTQEEMTVPYHITLRDSVNFKRCVLHKIHPALYHIRMFDKKDDVWKCQEKHL